MAPLTQQSAEAVALSATQGWDKKAAVRNFKSFSSSDNFSLLIFWVGSLYQAALLRNSNPFEPSHRQSPEPQRWWDSMGQTWTSAFCWKCFQKENNTGYGTADPNTTSRRGGLEEQRHKQPAELASKWSWYKHSSETRLQSWKPSQKSSHLLPTWWNESTEAMDLSQLPCLWAFEEGKSTKLSCQNIIYINNREK